MKKANDWFKKIQKALQPPRAFSWQTMILIGIFYWSMALFALGVAAVKNQPTIWVYDFGSNFGWIFLIIGLHWWTVERNWFVSGFPIGAWFTGFLVCMYLFVWVFGDVTVRYPALPFASWPLISAAISTLHKINDARLNPKIPRLTTLQEVVILILINLVFSCWLEFHFVVQGWLQEYPSLQADELDRSAFVWKLESPTAGRRRGYKILDAIANTIQNQVENKPWSEGEKSLAATNKKLQQQKWPSVRQWMLNLPGMKETVKKEILANLETKEEDFLWYIDAKLEERVEDYYQLVLKAIWRGPSSRPNGYELTKTCKIEPKVGQVSPRPNQPNQRPSNIGSMTCEDGSDPLKDKNQQGNAAPSN